MLRTLAIGNYRSLRDVVIPLGRLNLVTGPNGSGKSNLYRALRLIAQTAEGGVVSALAREGGLPSTFWAGPEQLSRRMKTGEVPVQGGPRQRRVRLKLGFLDDDFGYAISLGLPQPSSPAGPNPTRFALDPEIKRETIWAGAAYRPASALVDRNGPAARVRDGRQWRLAAEGLQTFDSIFGQIADPEGAPEVLYLRERLRSWRFYDHFRTDPEAPARIPQLGTRTMALHHDGRDLAAALQTILEIGDARALAGAIADAFPGARLAIDVQEDQRFTFQLAQDGLLRPLKGAELSDGTLRFLLWAAALLSPRPAPLLVLNEPETSLHPDLYPALARLIVKASQQTQVWVVSHAAQLIAALQAHPECGAIGLEKELGETRIQGQGPLDAPPWHWPERK